MARKPDKVVVVAAAMLVVAVASVVYVSGKPSPVAPPPGPAPLPEVAGPPDAGAALSDKLEGKTPKSKKAQLVKRELKKRAEAEKKLAAASAMPTGASRSSSSSSSSPSGVDVVLSGDDKLVRALRKKMKDVRLVDASTRGFALSLHSAAGKQGGNVYVRCSAAISALPAKKLLASLASRADVPGGSPEDEAAAADACAASLAEDVSAWVNQHR